MIATAERPPLLRRAPADRLVGRALRAAVAVFGAVLALGVVGFMLSFQRVAAAARPSFGRLAPLVPLGVDLGILVFSAVGLLLAYLDMPARWVRLVPTALTGVTVWLNVDGEPTWFGRVAHATLPSLWIVAVGIAEHVIKIRLALDTGRRMDQVRLARWMLAPRSTLLMWRRMVLWEELDYARALDRERQRLEFGARLRDRFGWRWRWRAPRLVRVLYRLELYVRADEALSASPTGGASVGTAPDPRLDDGTTGHGRTGIGPDRSDRTGSANRTGRRTRPDSRTGRSGRTGRTGSTRKARSVDDLYAQLVGLVADGKLSDRPSAEAVRLALRCSATNAREVQRRYVAVSSNGGAVVDATHDQDSSDDD